MRVKRTGAVAIADTLSSHLIIRDCNQSVVPSFVSDTATVWFRFTGNNSTRQPTLFCVSNIVGAMCERVRSSWKVFALQVFSRFLADYNRKYCAFLIKEMLFSKI